MELKLHLGCGTVYLGDTWVNVDANGLLAKDNPDLMLKNLTTIDRYYKYPYGGIGDIGNRPGGNEVVVDKEWDLADIPYPWRGNSVDQILAVSILEHFTEDEVKEMLAEWYRILKIGGEVFIDMPDLYKTLTYLDWQKNTKEHYYGISLIYGSQKNEYSFHKWGYTPDLLCETCRSIGFSPVTWIQNLIKHKYPMFMVKAIK